jgi:hypothetical protein
MKSQMTSTYNQQMTACTKTAPKILRVQKGEKRENAPGKARKKAKPGAFWVLEGMKAGGNR